MISPLGFSPTFGFGDRLGLATPGHIAALRQMRCVFQPVFAQQSVRENLRTGRTPQQVIDDARRAVEAADWDGSWGADADHLKSLDDLQPFVDAGYTFYTVDPGSYIDQAADTDSVEVLKSKITGWIDWAELASLYLGMVNIPCVAVFEPDTLLRAAVKYGKAIQHTVLMYRRLREMRDDFDFEVSVDETDTHTTPLEHFFIANELTRLGVKFTSLAPRFIGRFEKGVDYVGNLSMLDVDMAQHAAVTAYFGTYKISLHSGSDKFSVYPLLVKHWGDRIHIKTAGTSYLEALRTLSVNEPDLFGKIWELSLKCYRIDRVSYHVSADPALVPVGIKYPAFLDNFYAREILHVTFGSVLNQYGEVIKLALKKHSQDYFANLQEHFQRHLKYLI